MIRQASCVAIDGRAVLIEGAPGIGKSSLALALIDRGAVLVSDDAVTLSADPMGALIAAPAPNIAGLLEVRGVGLVSFPTSRAPVCLLIRLSKDAPRMVETAEHIEIEGCKVPSLMLYPESFALALRAEQALRLHGLIPAITT